GLGRPDPQQLTFRTSPKKIQTRLEGEPGVRDRAQRGATTREPDASLSTKNRSNRVANTESTGTQGARAGEEQDLKSRTELQPAKARRLRSRLHPDAKEAEFGASESRESQAHKRDGSHNLHPWNRAQPAGALDRADPRRPR